VNGFLSGMAMFGAISFVPLFLQHVIGMSATAAGVVLIPFVLGWVAMSIVSARLVLRVGYRAPVLAGMTCLAVGFLLLTRWGPGDRRRYGRRRSATRSARPARARAGGVGGLARRAARGTQRRSRHRPALRHRRGWGYRRQSAGARRAPGARAEGRAHVLRGAA